MKDLIDLANLVFNQLIKEHGETEESRLLFLYGATTSTRWTVINSQKWVLIDSSGVSKNFDDAVLTGLNSDWTGLVEKAQADQTALALKRMREEYDIPAPRPGSTFEFGKGGGEFRHISL